MTYFVFLEAVLENVLHDKTSSLAQSNLVPHTTQGIIDILHDLRRRVTPAQLKELLPDMASIAVDHCLGNAAEKLMNHDSLVVLRDRVKCLLNNMAAKGVHGEAESVSADSLCDLDNLLGGAVLEATLDQKVAKAVDHQRECLLSNGLDNVEALLGSTHLELLLKKNGRLLVVAGDDLVNNVALITVDITVEQATVVQRLSGGHERLMGRRGR